MKEYWKNRYRIVGYIIIIVCFFKVGGHCQTNSSSEKPKKKKDWSKIYDKAKNSVVLIDYPNNNSIREVGSGVVVGIEENGDAYVLTAFHVLKKDETKESMDPNSLLDTVHIYYYRDQTNYDIGLVENARWSATDDIGLVKIINPSRKLEPINFSKKTPKEGMLVGAIGHPEGEGFTWSDGSVNKIQGKYITHTINYMIGHSGGPLLNRSAQMIGLNVHVVYKAETESEASGQLESGENVTLASGTITAQLENWLNRDSLKEKWKEKRYGSFWMSPGFYIPATTVAGTAIYGLLTPSTTPDPFGGPPEPPDN